MPPGNAASCAPLAEQPAVLLQVLDPPANRTDEGVGEQLLRELVFIHLTSKHDKFNLLILMLRKLYALVRPHPRRRACRLFVHASRPDPQASGTCQGDNPDSMMHQEALLPGHLIQQFMKERLQDLQTRLKEVLLKEATEKPGVSFDDPPFVERCITKACGLADIGKRMEYLLATGNLVSRSGMGLSQTSGFTIVAEKLNFLRYISHFRSVHRGAYFQELRTTTVRCSPFPRASVWLMQLPTGPQIAARLLGLHVPGAHARRLALRLA